MYVYTKVTTQNEATISTEHDSNQPLWMTTLQHLTFASKPQEFYMKFKTGKTKCFIPDRKQIVQFCILLL